MIKYLFKGTCLKVPTATGNKTKPEEIIRKEATCKAVTPTRPSLIKIKLLPQIKDRIMKMNQLRNLAFKA